MPQSLAAVYVHYVFSTKNRHPFLEDTSLRLEVFANLTAVAGNLDCPMIAVGGVGDHVHLLLRLSRNLAIAQCVKEIKRVSSIEVKGLSRSLREFSWQSGYGAFSVDQIGIGAVRHYIANQEQHHKTETFKEEFLRLLREHDLEWDDRYVWD